MLLGGEEGDVAAGTHINYGSVAQVAPRIATYDTMRYLGPFARSMGFNGAAVSHGPALVELHKVVEWQVLNVCYIDTSLVRLLALWPSLHGVHNIGKCRKRVAS